DDLRIGELALDLGDAAFDKALPLFGRIVLRVLGQVAVRTRILYRLNGARTLYGLQLMQLGAQHLRAGRGQRDLPHPVSSPFHESGGAGRYRARPRLKFVCDGFYAITPVAGVPDR